MVNKCLTCNKELINDKGAISFKCPKCDFIIMRCSECRRKGSKYVCPKCGFEGPN